MRLHTIVKTLKAHDQLRSRYSNSGKYFVYVLLDKRKSKLDAIIGHTCGSMDGERVVGCCSRMEIILLFFFILSDSNRPSIYLEVC